MQLSLDTREHSSRKKVRMEAALVIIAFGIFFFLIFGAEAVVKAFASGKAKAAEANARAEEARLERAKIERDNRELR